MIFKKLFSAITLFFLFSCGLYAIIGSSKVYGAEFTFNQPVGFVNDFENIIDDSQQNELESTLSNLKTEKGVEVVVVTTEDLHGDSIELFANDLYDYWKINSKGVLLVVSKKNRLARIEVGYEMEYLFTDAISGRILDNYVIPKLKVDDFTGGIYDGANYIASQVAFDEENVVSYNFDVVNSSKYMFFISTIVFLLVAMLFGAIFMSASKKWWPGGVFGFLLGLFLSFLYKYSIPIAMVVAVVAGVVGLIADFIFSSLGSKQTGKFLFFLFRLFMGGVRSSGSGSSRSSGGSFGGFSGGGGGSSGGGASRGF